MSAEDIDEYLRRINEPKRSTLEALRRTILEIVPDADQVISYKVPAFRVDGRIVAGFAAFKGSPQLPALQRLGAAAARERARGVHDDQERTALSRRLPTPEDARRQADRGAPFRLSAAVARWSRPSCWPSRARTFRRRRRACSRSAPATARSRERLPRPATRCSRSTHNLPERMFARSRYTSWTNHRRRSTPRSPSPRSITSSRSRNRSHTSRSC